MNNPLSFPGLGLTLDFDRVAFSIGGFNVYWYGVVIALGFALALIYAFKNAKKFGVDPDRMVDVVIGGMIGGIVGARLYYVAFTWDQYKNDLLSIFSTRSGGLAIYGGIIGALLVGGLVCKWRKVKLLPMFDIAGIGFLIGQCLGRWGNFFNVEAYGSNTSLPWGMTSPSIQQELTENLSTLTAQGMDINPLMPVHPTFLYESLWCLAGFLLLNWYWKRRKFDGEVFLMYVAWYGAGRCWIEGLRTDSLMLGPVRVSQILAGVCVVVAVAAILFIRNKMEKSADPDYCKLYVNTEAWQEELRRMEQSSKKKKHSEPEEAAEIQPDFRIELDQPAEERTENSPEESEVEQQREKEDQNEQNH